MLYCFLDTNMFLHFQPFDNINWLNVLKVDKVTICITFKTLSELDEKKREQKHRNKVISVQKKIKQYKDEQLDENISFQIIQEASYNWLRENGFDPENPDSKIIGNISFFKSQNIADDIIIITDDVNFQLRAEAKGLRYFEIDEKYRLPSELSAEQKELQKLRREIQILENARPKLAFSFLAPESDSTKTNKLDYSVDFTYDGLSEDEIAEYIFREKEELLSEVDHSLDSLYGGLIFSSQNYKQQVEMYLQQLETYYLELSKYKIYRTRTREVSFILNNIGKKPAENIDISLFIDGDVKIANTYRQLPERPSRPKKPSLEQTLDRSMIFGADFPTFEVISQNDRPTETVKFKSHLNQVELNFANLKHTRNYSWFILITSNTYTQPQQFVPIKYHITADNITEPITGTLTLNISST